METTSSSSNKKNLLLSLEGVPLLPWPSEVFPSPFREFIKELARSTETPVELAGLLTLAVVATAGQAKYRVQIKEDYHEPVNIWVLPVLPPASRKSGVYSAVTLPFRNWEREIRDKLTPEIEAAASRRKTMEARIKELRNKLAKQDSSKHSNMGEELIKLERELPEIPNCPRLWTGDITPEQLGNIMAINGESMACLSDEGALFDILGGLYSDGRANIDLFLQAHAASPVRIDRGSRPPILMQQPVLTMALTVQPQVIKKITSNKTFRGRGLLGRFLYAIPPSNIGCRTFEQAPMNKEDSTRYNEAIRWILSHPYTAEGGKHTLVLDQSAYSKWLEYAKAVEVMMGPEADFLAHITDWAGKLPGAIARIAAIFHIMQFAEGKPWEHAIGDATMSAAVKIGHCLINHALKIFDFLYEDDALPLARDIMSWVNQNKLFEFTQRECLRKFRRVKKVGLQPALNLLKEAGYLEEKMNVPIIGRPSIAYVVLIPPD